MAVLGRVESSPSRLPWRVVFPDAEHTGSTSYLRELAASDCSPLTVRSYAFDLSRWFRFLHERLIDWERAERVDVRAFVEHLREAPNPKRLRRRPDGPPSGSVNAVTGKAELSSKYAPRTINHQLSVLFGLYDHACAAGLGPLVNLCQHSGLGGGGRSHAHHNPMQDSAIHRRANYRQKTPRPLWRGILDEAATTLFEALRSHRDRHTVTVTSKGSRAREVVPASVDSFVWLSLYLADQQPPMSPGGPL